MQTQKKCSMSAEFGVRATAVFFPAGLFRLIFALSPANKKSSRAAAQLRREH